MIKAFIRTKTFFIIIAIIVVGLGAGYRHYSRNSAIPEYETVTVAYTDLKQTVDAVGKVTSVDDLSLHFEMTGTVGSVLVAEGESVKKWQTLTTLRLSELTAAVAEAQANLDQKLAGLTEEDKRYYQAAVDSAKAAYEEAIIDADTSVASAESAVATAKNNLKFVEGGDHSLIVSQAYESAVTKLYVAVPKMDDALTQADNILGIDNVTANDAFESSLSSRDPSIFFATQTSYLVAKKKRDTARTSITNLTTTSSHESVDQALSFTLDALQELNILLENIMDVLEASVDTSFDAKKTTIETTRGTIAVQYTDVVDRKQEIADAFSSLDGYAIAHEKALRDLDQARANRDTSIAIKKAAYDQALATMQGKLNPPREVDVAALRAGLTRAIASRNKAIITAPMDGVITGIEKNVGEVISSSEPMIRMLSPHYEVEVDIPETDITKVVVGQSADIALDAFQGNTAFSGTVVAIDPASTNIQDVVYYQIRIRIADTGLPIKPGMTANVTIHTDERQHVLAAPLRAIKTSTDGRIFVRVVRDGQEIETNVATGLKADDGLVEIVYGVDEGDAVVVGTKKK